MSPSSPSSSRSTTSSSTSLTSSAPWTSRPSTTRPVEVILVNDGTPDESAAIAEKWATVGPTPRSCTSRTPARAAARNAGLDVATGKWVTFCDPDDVLASDYLEGVGGVPGPARGRTTGHGGHPDPHLHGGVTSVSYDRHPLRSNFYGGDQLVDLTRFPERIQPVQRHQLPSTRPDRGHAPLRHANPSDVRGRALRGAFPRRCRRAGRRVHGIGEVLLPQAGGHLLGGPVRLGQRRQVHDGPATRIPGCLEYAAARLGSVPLWLQNTVLYDIAWYFRADAQITSLTGSIPHETLAEFHELMGQIMVHIEDRDGPGLPHHPDGLDGRADDRRRLPERGHPSPGGVPGPHRQGANDVGHGCYYFAVRRPTRTSACRGLPGPAGLCQDAGAPGLRQDLAARTDRLAADGGRAARHESGRGPLPSSPVPQGIPPYSLSPERLWRVAGIAPARRRPRLQVRPGRAGRRSWPRWSRQGGAPVVRPGPADCEGHPPGTPSCPHVRRRYRDTSILLDRPDQAQDNAEHFYRYLQRRRPAVNAFFVLERTVTGLVAAWRPTGSGSWSCVLAGVACRPPQRRARGLLQANGFAVAPLRRRPRTASPVPCSRSCSTASRRTTCPAG